MINFTKKGLFRTSRWQLSLLLLLFGAFVMAQRPVKGTVYSKEDNAPLPGVSVIEKGTNNGVVSDGEGNFTINVKGENAELEFSFLGRRPITLSAANAAMVYLQEDATQLSDVVVSTTRTPVRKIETTTAIEVISAKQLERSKPEGIFEAVQNTPGLFVNTSQGRRGFVTTRGFPDGSPTGGLVYTGILLDGIPTFGTPGKLPEAGFGFDVNVERVEVVRGSAATLFGRASAAGVINVISRTGGDKLGGTVRVTNYNDILGQGAFNYRADFNLNGPISENIRFNVGGWYLNDNGFRNTGFNDAGGQVRANVDFLFPKNKGSIRVYGMYSNFNFQNLTDIAVDPSTMSVAEGWKNTDTYQSRQLGEQVGDFRIVQAGRPVTDARTGEPVVRNLLQTMEDGSYGRGGHIGLKLNYDLGNDWAIENHFRYQKIFNGVKYGFALPTFYPASGVTRLYLDGDAEDTDIINEIRIRKYVETGSTKHNISMGAYYSAMNLLPTTWSYIYISNTDPNDLRARGFGPPTAPAPATGSVTRRGEYDENVLAFFIGDEMKINNRLTVNLGARYDMLSLDMRETKIPFDTTLTRVENFADWSASIGVNYLINQRTAVYGNINRAFRMPDYSAFTSLEFVPGTTRWLRAPDGINDNEVILNMEVGYRSGYGDFGFDVAGFYTNIDNRLASVFENGLLVAKPLGQNRIVGSELSITYAPSQVRGLLLRGSLTLQDARFVDFNIPLSRNAMGNLNVNLEGNLFDNTIVNEGGGNYSIDLKGKRLPGVPNTMLNLFAGYDSKYWGFDFSYNSNYGRYTDATNILELGTLSIANAGFYGKYPMKGGSEVRVGLQARNLFNSTSIQGLAATAENDTVLVTAQNNPTFSGILAHGYVQLPRRIMFHLTYSF
jgi:iron complex outermembrane receptor protein